MLPRQNKVWMGLCRTIFGFGNSDCANQNFVLNKLCLLQPTAGKLQTIFCKNLFILAMTMIQNLKLRLVDVWTWKLE